MRTMLFAAATLGGLLTSTAPGHAIIQAEVDIQITPYATYHEVCGSGQATSGPIQVGQWVLAVHGSRSNGQGINQTMSTAGKELPEQWCTFVPKFGAEMGEYQASLTFVGVGTEFVGEEIQYGAWQPGIAGLESDITVPVEVPRIEVFHS